MKLLRDTLIGHALPELVRLFAFVGMRLHCLRLLPQLAFLGTMVSEDIFHVGFLRELKPLMEILHSLFSKFPGLSLQLGASELKGEEESVLRFWTRESVHNYENNMRVNEVGQPCL